MISLVLFFRKPGVTLVHLEIVLILMQDRYTVCAEYTMCMAVILGTPDETPS
jgi:hypothetical protein